MRKFSVLLADDEELALLGLAEGVEWGNLNIENIYKCHSKESAIKRLKVSQVDIIITDIEMPNGNGIELIRWVRENKPEIKSIFYTGHAEFSYAQEALRLGAEDFLLKPVSYDDLEKIIEKIENKILIREKTVDLSELAKDIKNDNPEEIVDKAKKVIAENISVSSLTREDLAAKVHVSSGYLGRIFKKQTGINITNYIIKKRVAVAKQLLDKTNLSMTNISERVGISYSSYFTKIFKEHVGMTPHEYRHKHKKN